MRLITDSDSDDVLSGNHAPAVPLSILENSRTRHPSATWHTFTARRSEDQQSVEKFVAMIEAQVADLRDSIAMCDPEDVDEGAWRLVDRIESANAALGYAGRELRDLL